MTLQTGATGEAGTAGTGKPALPGTRVSATILSQGGDAHCLLPQGGLTSCTGGSTGLPTAYGALGQTSTV